jgi:hypothetical protein
VYVLPKLWMPPAVVAPTLATRGRRSNPIDHCAGPKWTRSQDHDGAISAPSWHLCPGFNAVRVPCRPRATAQHRADLGGGGNELIRFCRILPELRIVALLSWTSLLRSWRHFVKTSPEVGVSADKPKAFDEPTLNIALPFPSPLMPIQKCMTNVMMLTAAAQVA